VGACLPGSGIVKIRNPKTSFTDAVSVAMQADVAILFLGTNQLLESEGINRQYITLPPVQLRLLQRVLEANPKTVVVLLNGGPVSLARPSFGGKRQGSREMDIPAVLDMFWAGEEGGTAIADVLFGDYNQSGRLPYTVYSSDRDLPPMTQYDISKGFTYMYLNGSAAFWLSGLRFNCRSPNFSQGRRKSTDIRSRARPPLKLMCNICRSVWR